MFQGKTLMLHKSLPRANQLFLEGRVVTLKMAQDVKKLEHYGHTKQNPSNLRHFCEFGQFRSEAYS